MATATHDKVGSKTHRITIQSAAEAQNAIGEPIPTWSAITNGTVWAERLEPFGNEQLAADQRFANRRVVFVIWYRTDVTAKHRVVEGSEAFDIQDVRRRDGKPVEMELDCIQRGV